MHTFLIAAISKDGFIAEKVAQASTAWTSPEDAKFFRQRTKEAGVMVMGRATFATIGRPLPGRMMIVLTRQLTVDNFQTQNVDLQVQELDGATHANAGVYISHLDPYHLIGRVERLGFSELAVCGGASVYRQFLEAGLLDTLYLTIEPVTFGHGVPLFGEGVALPDFRQIAHKIQLGKFVYVLQNQSKLNESGTTLAEYFRL